MKNEYNTPKDAISYDGLHPNAESYKIMQPLAEEAISPDYKARIY